MKIFQYGLALLCMAWLGSASANESYPSKPVTLVTPFAAGGASDMVTRVLAQAMQKNLGQPLVVHNVPGAGGNLGAHRVAQAKPDGYTILLHHTGIATAPALFKDLQFDPVTSFEQIGLFVDTPMVIVGAKDFEPNDMAELLRYVRTHRDKVTFASSGAGSATHLCAMLFEAVVGTKVTMVQYRGAAPALLDVQAGRVNLLCDATPAIVQPIRAGTVKPYVLTTKERLASLPALPTAAELGLPSLENSAWFGLYAPAGTPQPIIDRLAVALQAAVQDAETRDRIAKMDTQMFDVSKADPKAHKEMLQSQIKFWTTLIRNAGIEAR